MPAASAEMATATSEPSTSTSTPRKAVSAPEKKYKCQFCNRAFSRSEHRSRHERSRKSHFYCFWEFGLRKTRRVGFPFFFFVFPFYCAKKYHSNKFTHSLVLLYAQRTWKTY